MIQTTNSLLFSVMGAFIVYRLSQQGFANPPLPAMLLAVATLGNWVYIRGGGSLDIGSWFILGLLTLGLITAGANSGAFTGGTVFMSPILPVLAILLVNARAGWH